jgi:phosphatidylserine decarboxylase
MQEAVHPVSSFKTFNEFFIRTLKKDARPINNDPKVLVSPADSFVIGKQSISLHDRFPIKEISLNLIECLGSKELAEEFDGGSVLIFRLAPWHYHRFHFPVSCTPSLMKCIHGDYDSVNPLVYQQSLQPLQTNERCLIELHNTPCSTMLLIPVGALFVGAITATYAANLPTHKGDEAGYFSFGGSTILLLAKKGCIEIDTPILENSKLEKETSIHMGQKVGTIIKG